MKRSTVLLSACLVALSGAWLAQYVGAQTGEKEKTYTITRSQFDDAVAKAVAAEREKMAHEKAATDEQVLNPQNWHKAIFNKAEYVIYTGPGQFMFHHWVQPDAKAPAAKGAAAAPPAKGG